MCRYFFSPLFTAIDFKTGSLAITNAVFLLQFVEQEGGRQMLQLWVAASNFRQQLIEHAGMYDPQQAQADAMVLYDK